MDTQITVGGYRTTIGDAHAGLVDYWGYAVGPAIGTENVVETVHDGSLGDAAFVYQGVEYTVKRLTTGLGRRILRDRDRGRGRGGPAGHGRGRDRAAGVADRRDSAVRLAAAGGRNRAVYEEFETLLAAWRNAPGTVLPVRILNLDASDVWSANLHYGTVTSLTVGYGAPATGTLTATGFFLNGVEYTVDRLTVVSTTETEAVVRFATTPDLPATAQLRLAVPRSLYNPGLNRYLALEPASLVSGGTDVDYEWPWPGDRRSGQTSGGADRHLLPDPGPGPDGRRVGVLGGDAHPERTRQRRRTSGLPRRGAEHYGLYVGVRRRGHAGARHDVAGRRHLHGRSARHRVRCCRLAGTLSLRTDPLLPRGQDLWLELEHVDGSTAVFAIDTATVEAPGYLWRDAYAGEDRHGWGTDGSDADTDIDSVTVRLSTGRADHHGHGAGGPDADGGHHRHHGCGRADQRHLHLPVDPGERHGCRHCGREFEHLHPGRRRPGQGHQGQGELHRRRQQCRDADQRGDGDGDGRLVSTTVSKVTQVVGS